MALLVTPAAAALRITAGPVAVPVLAPDGRILASLACSTSLARQKLDQLVVEVVPELEQAVRHIEFELRRCPLLVHSITS
jgi:DNA-binding IclR family transcriptional regulator